MAKGRKTEYEKMREIETYEHKGKKRSNNPTAGMAARDTEIEPIKTYSHDPHIDPTLQWTGKEEGLSFEVQTSSIYIHESIKPHKIIKSVQKLDDAGANRQPSLFESDVEYMRRRREAIEFYRHDKDWTNRMIAGDSLIIMNSLLEKERMASQVQMVYIDPPYGIKYGSNFQPFVNKREVKDGKDEDLTAEPETIKAFRDTWELGIHSYLTYMRDRLLLARELLHESGSVFVQISDENVHLVRCLCDEVFGAENFVSLITFTKTVGQSTKVLPSICDYLIWYAKDKSVTKSKKLFSFKEIGGTGATGFTLLESPDKKNVRALTREELANPKIISPDWLVFDAQPLVSQGWIDSLSYKFHFEGEVFVPPSNRHWTTTEQNMKRLHAIGRLIKTGKTLQFKKYLNDFPVTEISNVWIGLGERGFTGEKIYVVQTAAEAIKRCMLMTTDPGDLVLDITCGSGTTAYVAEQWGRRWITCDTSRVAITIAKKRLMTASFDYYRLADEERGVASGFVYKTVPHVTLKSIANNEPASEETLYDQPQVDKRKMRITGPFTVEALPAPIAKPLDDDSSDLVDYTAKYADWRAELLACGIIGRGGNRIEFSSVELLAGHSRLQAIVETKEDVPRRAVVCFAGETKPLDIRMADKALDEMVEMKPAVNLLILAAYQFDPEVADFVKKIEQTNGNKWTVLMVQMNTDLMTADLKKNRASNESFWLVGQPDVELIALDNGMYRVRVHGFDYYNVNKGLVESGEVDKIEMWMLDTNYDRQCIEPVQVFFPRCGKDGWGKLAKTLKTEIHEELIEQYAGCESLPFSVGDNKQICVKVVDDRAIESLKVIKVGE